MIQSRFDPSRGERGVSWRYGTRRGGSWRYGAQAACVAYCDAFNPSDRSRSLSLRLLRRTA